MRGRRGIAPVVILIPILMMAMMMPVALMGMGGLFGLLGMSGAPQPKPRLPSGTIEVDVGPLSAGTTEITTSIPLTPETTGTITVPVPEARAANPEVPEEPSGSIPEGGA